MTKEKFFDTRKEYVARFIYSYLVCKKLEEIPGFDEDEDMETSREVKLSPVNPFSDEELEAGQVRLLGGETDRITYVALLRKWEEDSFVVAPFSAHSVPATDEEFLTEYDGGLFQRVLQIWNIRTLNNKLLKESWLIGQLPQNDIDDAWTLWLASLGGKQVEDRLLEKTALPIYKKEDPRLEYKRLELKNFARLDAEDIALMDEMEKDEPVLMLRRYVPAKNVLAAGDEEENLQFRFVAEGMAIECFIEYSRYDRKLSLYVNAISGETSQALDGCRVCDAAGNVLGIVSNGVMKVDDYQLSEDSAIRIQDADGNAIQGFFEDCSDD